MLILNRYPGQSFTIYLEDGRKINVRPLEIDWHGYIRIGINADKSINIVRDELIKQDAKDARSVGLEPTTFSLEG